MASFCHAAVKRYFKNYDYKPLIFENAGSHFAFILSSVMALFANIVAAKPTVIETQPIEGDPLLDYRIETCSGIKGFGMYSYRPGGLDDTKLTLLQCIRLVHGY